MGRGSALQGILAEDGRAVVLAIDHGAYIEPTPGLERPEKAIRAAMRGGADAVIANLGLIRREWRLMRGRVGIVLSIPHLPRDVEKLLRVVEDFGVDCLKLFVPVGGPDEKESLARLWELSLAIHDHGIPLMAEMVPQQERGSPHTYEQAVVMRCARIGFEYGADLIKVPYTASVDSFRAVVEYCPAPVLVLGGPRRESDEEILRVAHGAVTAGGAGIAFGRSIWQHTDPERITRALCRVVHEGWSVERALRIAEAGTT